MRHTQAHHCVTLGSGLSLEPHINNMMLTRRPSQIIYLFGGNDAIAVLGRLEQVLPQSRVRILDRVDREK